MTAAAVQSAASYELLYLAALLFTGMCALGWLWVNRPRREPRSITDRRAALEGMRRVHEHLSPAARAVVRREARRG